MPTPTAEIPTWRYVSLALISCLLFAGCTGSSSVSEDVVSSDSAPQTSTSRPTATPAPTPVAPTAEAKDATMDELEPTNTTATGCDRLTDFSSEAERQAWQTVNDNVMGGRSSGGPTFDDGLMIFSGETNTDGGGFSSLRLALTPDTLRDFERVELRARPDGREYMVTFDDNVGSRDRRVSHRATLNFDSTGGWQTVSVDFDELFPAIFGRPVDDLPFDKTLATRMGIMISDGLDGPFRLEIDWIEVCR